MVELSELYWKECDDELIISELMPVKNTDTIPCCPKCQDELILISCPACMEREDNMNICCEYCNDIGKWYRCPKCQINLSRN